MNVELLIDLGEDVEVFNDFKIVAAILSCKVQRRKEKKKNKNN